MENRQSTYTQVSWWESKRLGVCPCVHLLLLFRLQTSDSFAPWTVAHQAPLSVGFPRQEYWSELPFPSPGDLPDLGSNSGFLFGRQILYQLSHCVSIPALQTGRMNFFWGNLHFYMVQLQKQLQLICTDRDLVWRIRNVQCFGRGWGNRVCKLGFQEWFPEQKYCAQPWVRSGQLTAPAISK